MDLQHNLIEITEVESMDDYKVGDILEVSFVENAGVNVLNTKQQYVYNYQFRQADEPKVTTIKQPANLSITECNDLLQEASEAKPLDDGWYERKTKYANDIIYVRGGQNYHHIHSLSSCHNLNGETLRPIKVDLS